MSAERANSDVSSCVMRLKRLRSRYGDEVFADALTEVSNDS